MGSIKSNPESEVKIRNAKKRKFNSRQPVTMSDENQDEDINYLTPPKPGESDEESKGV